MTPKSPILPTNPQVPEIVLAKDQPEYLPLPVVVVNSIGPTTVVTRWELSDEDREAVASGGTLWLETYTFGEDYQPIRPTFVEPFGEVVLAAPCKHENRKTDPEPWPTGGTLETCADCGMCHVVSDAGDSGWVMVPNIEAVRHATAEISSQPCKKKSGPPSSLWIGPLLYVIESLVEMKNAKVGHEDVSEHDTVAIDSRGRICRSSQHFLDASEEGAFPICVYLVR